MPGQRFIDRLIADTLSERYQPCKESGDMLDTCEAVEDAMRAWQKVLKTGDLHFSIYEMIQLYWMSFMPKVLKIHRKLRHLDFLT
jgi:hypothetical protein